MSTYADVARIAADWLGEFPGGLPSELAVMVMRAPHGGAPQIDVQLRGGANDLRTLAAWSEHLGTVTVTRSPGYAADFHSAALHCQRGGVAIEVWLHLVGEYVTALGLRLHPRGSTEITATELRIAADHCDDQRAEHGGTR